MIGSQSNYAFPVPILTSELADSHQSLWGTGRLLGKYWLIPSLNCFLLAVLCIGVGYYGSYSYLIHDLTKVTGIS